MDPIATKKAYTQCIGLFCSLDRNRTCIKSLGNFYKIYMKIQFYMYLYINVLNNFILCLYKHI
jgi:hypothetical protein